MSRYIVPATIVTATLGFITFKILEVIYQEHNHRYVDEIFHVDQAQRYCNNNWLEWDPKITTFPGLYLTSYALLKPLHFIGYHNFCTLFALRATNVLATILNFLLALKIIISQDKKYMGRTHFVITLTSALNIAIFPPLYFFTFLYYTDVWSTTFVLLMLNLHLGHGKKFFIFTSCILAVLMRQTNIIWVGFILIEKVWEILGKDFKSPTVQKYLHTKKIIQHSISKIFNFKKKQNGCVNLISTLFLETYHLIFICTMFLTFIYFNGGIVLGDKNAHVPVLHPMQNFYFLSFVAFFGWPFSLLEVPSIWKKPPKVITPLFLLILILLLSEFNKLEHPYLLADNRHLAFYIWKRIFGHHIIRRLIIPVHVVSSLLFYRSLQKRNHFMLTVGLLSCIFFNLTPQHLFEIRYFILPYIMWRLHLKQHPVVFIETIFFVIVNIAVIYLFLRRPFEWPNEPGVTQRFIW